MENKKISESHSKNKARLGRISNQVRGNAINDQHEEKKEYSTANTRKKFLPNRKNRGQKLLLLTSNEGNMEEDKFYSNIFQEESSDEDFIPSQSENESDDDSLNDNRRSSEVEEYDVEKQSESESENHQEKNQSSNFKEKEEDMEEASGENRRYKEEEEVIYDIDQLDIDKIDEIEEMRDRGIDVDNMDLDDLFSDDISSKRRKKKKSKSKKRKESQNKIAKPILLVENNEVVVPNKKKTVSSAFIDDEDDNTISKKRNRAFLKRKKETKNNPNVQIAGNRFKPYSIKVLKSAFLPENDQCQCEEKEDIMKYNDEAYKQNYTFEQEKDTQSIIKKYKKQEQGETFEKKYSWIQDRPSQKDLLFEAIFTEYYNMKSLEAMQRLDDLNKRDMYNTSSKKKFADYVKILKRIHSGKCEEDIKENNLNDTCLTFSNTEIYSKIFETFNSKEDPKDIKLCAITGKPAKYFDPLTKQYYLSVEEFKILRERYFQKEEDGLLFRIQTLSDLASQKKEKLKKMILSDDTPGGGGSTAASSSNAVPGNLNTTAILSIVNKFGILKSDGSDFEKRAISRKINK